MEDENNVNDAEDQKIDEASQTDEGNDEHLENKDAELKQESNDNVADESAEEQRLVPKGVQKKLDKLTAEKKLAQDELRRLKAQQQQARISAYENVDVSTGQPLVAPNVNDYEDWREYEADKESYQRKAYESRQYAESQKRALDEAAKLQDKLDKKVSLARQKYDDFDSIESLVMSDTFPISPAMADIVINSANGDDLLYWLGKNPGESARLASLSPSMATYELGKIGSQMEKPKPLKTNAPKPIKSESNAKSYATVSDAEFKKMMGII